jgi:hypothetical protein
VGLNGIVISLAVVASSVALVGCSGGHRADSCADLGDQVEGYNVLDDGNSRGGYLVLLHTLQRDCPSEAARRGLDAAAGILPRCERLDEEDCTMSRASR